MTTKSKRDPAFLFYDGDAARDVSHMNRLERGAYFDLIQAQRKYGFFTTDQIKKVLGHDFEIVWPALEVVLTKTDTGLLHIEWVTNSSIKRNEYTERQRKRKQEYWDKLRSQELNFNQENSKPRLYHGITTEIPLIENENEIEIVIVNNDNIENIDKEEGVGEEKDVINFERIKEIWNNLNTPKVRDLTQQRKDKIKRRIRSFRKYLKTIGHNQDDYILFFQAICAKINESDFCSGRKTNWKATFDWLFDNDENWLKVVEGNYDNNKNTGGKRATIADVMVDLSTKNFINL